MAPSSRFLFRGTITLMVSLTLHFGLFMIVNTHNKPLLHDKSYTEVSLLLTNDISVGRELRQHKTSRFKNYPKARGNASPSNEPNQLLAKEKRTRNDLTITDIDSVELDSNATLKMRNDSTTVAIGNEITSTGDTEVTGENVATINGDLEEKSGSLATGAQASKAIRRIYPRLSRILGEEGSVVLLLQLSQNDLKKEIVASSGYKRLDAAAIDMVMNNMDMFLAKLEKANPLRLKFDFRLF